MTNFKTPTHASLLCGHHKCMRPMLWQMHDTSESRSFFHQIFEINLQ